MSVCLDQQPHQQHQHSQCLAPYTTNNKDWIKRLNKMLTLWLHRIAQRKQLRQLDERMLNDIGITAEQAAQEFNKPFWK